MLIKKKTKQNSVKTVENLNVFLKPSYVIVSVNFRVALHEELEIFHFIRILSDDIYAHLEAGEGSVLYFFDGGFVEAGRV